jgi:hypothetical protein
MIGSIVDEAVASLRAEYTSQLVKGGLERHIIVEYVIDKYTFFLYNFSSSLTKADNFRTRIAVIEGDVACKESRRYIIEPKSLSFDDLRDSIKCSLSAT